METTKAGEAAGRLNPACCSCSRTSRSFSAGRPVHFQAVGARAAGFGIETLAIGLSTSATVFRGSKTARAPQGAAALFVTYLREMGVLPTERSPSLEETWPTLAAFRRWMREQRGIKDSTLDTYQEILVDLLAALGIDPTA